MNNDSHEIPWEEGMEALGLGLTQILLILSSIIKI